MFVTCQEFAVRFQICLSCLASAARTPSTAALALSEGPGLVPGPRHLRLLAADFHLGVWSRHPSSVHLWLSNSNANAEPLLNPNRNRSLVAPDQVV